MGLQRICWVWCVPKICLQVFMVMRVPLSLSLLSVLSDLRWHVQSGPRSSP